MKAVFHGEPFRDFKSKKWYITFELDKMPTFFDELKDKVLNLTVKEYKEKRSLDANAYFYVLVNKIAEELKISDREVHDKLLSENLCFIYNDGVMDWKVTDTEPNKYGLLREGSNYFIDSLNKVVLTKEDGSYYTSKGKPKVGRIYWHIKGSHQMDSKEMSRLIGSTITEAKQLGIETMTPDEIERMVQQWDVKKGKSITP